MEMRITVRLRVGAAYWPGFGRCGSASSASCPRAAPTLTSMPRACDRDQVLAAGKHWYRQHGCVPTQHEWDESARGSRPRSKTIRRRWGWQALWADALGWDQSQRTPKRAWSRAAMIEALLKAHAQNGAWPSGKNWERTTVEHPAGRTYGLFGSGAAAVREAESEGLRICGQ